MHRVYSWLLTTVLLAALDAQTETELPEGPAVAWQPAFPAQAGFDRPLFVAFAPNDPEMAYVVTQPGLVFRIPRDGQKSDRQTFLDLSGKVHTDHMEEGLLGFAFDPAYAETGHVFVCYSERIPVRSETMANGKAAKSNRQSVVARFTVVAKDAATGPTVDPGSELEILTVFQPFGNHNGGTIVFGPDGMLYVGLGDGGAANDPYDNAQSKQNLLGKVLRLDVRAASPEQPYRVPADNPFVAEAGARGEIWCYGLRNPWRIAFDRATGELWCGDVGQNQLEEVDRLVKGGNFGWNVLEATALFDLRREKVPAPKDAVPPVAWYPHSVGLSVTGGHVYRGTKIPELVGSYVYADFHTLRAFAVREDQKGGAHRTVTLTRLPKQPSSFAEEPDGELLATCFFGRNGLVLRMVPAAKQ
ncbi:MAG: PQQ-dependent sugar dehydrogenase [Planctomycetes bacterium]|nr:PQQ-dependent sugar dehydrogenase [Planctomycetota bacterium]